MLFSLSLLDNVYDMKKCITFIYCCFGAIYVHAQQSDSLFVRNIFNELMTHSTSYDNLRYICKEIGPRLSGSANAQKAVETTARMLKQAGADTVYLQPCMVPHWVRGEKEKGTLQLKSGKSIPLHLCALGNAIGTPAKGIDASVVEVKSFEALDQLGASKIKGKIVFFNIPMNPTHLETFDAYGESGIARWNGPSQAAKYGAIGAVVRSLASNPDDYPHTGSTGYNDSFPKIPAIAISTNDANYLSSQLQQGNVSSVWFKTSCSMLPDEPSFNVIGEIKGSIQPAEIITIGGHLDSWDLAEGAHDDGAGVVQSIEVLRTFKALHYQPKRTIRIVLFMNEENGGRGGDAYLAEAKTKKEKHVFAIESDAGGFTPRGFSNMMKPAAFEKLMSWKNIFQTYGIDDLHIKNSGSDIESLSEVGAELAGLRTDSQRYFDVHHAATDTFESVSKRELELGAFSMAAIAYLVSEYGL